MRKMQRILSAAGNGPVLHDGNDDSSTGISIVAWKSNERGVIRYRDGVMFNKNDDIRPLGEVRELDPRIRTVLTTLQKVADCD